MRRARGFTLIEILLALAIFAILLSLVGTVLVQTLKTAAYLETQGTDQRLAAALLARIGADVQDAILTGNDDPPRFLASRGSEGGAEKVRLDLVTLADGQTDDKGRESDVCEAGYLCTTADGVRWQLYRREQPMVDERPTQGGEYLLLTDRLGSFTIQYSDDGSAWLDAYNSKERTRMPWLVRVAFSLLPPDASADEAPPVPPSFERIYFLNRYGLLPNGE